MKNKKVYVLIKDASEAKGFLKRYLSQYERSVDDIINEYKIPTKEAKNLQICK